jgi:hypothetical protein
VRRGELGILCRAATGNFLVLVGRFAGRHRNKRRPSPRRFRLLAFHDHENGCWHFMIMKTQAAKPNQPSKLREPSKIDCAAVDNQFH